METTKKTPIYNLVILDKSGSMSCVRKEAIDGFNETLGSIKATQMKYAETQEHFVSLATFCGCGIEMVYDKAHIDDVESLTPEKYGPCCYTPLFDAIGITVNDLRNNAAEGAAVLVTIITDGMENASKEWSAMSVCKLIESCKEDGWMFSFIGAGMDVIQVASTISITNTMVWENTSAGTEKMFSDENEARSRFCDRVYDMCSCNNEMPLEERKSMFRSLASEYYDDID